MAETALLRLYRDRIRPEWVDYNGHMNEAFYLLVFSRATDAFMDEIGLDHRSEERKANSLYTLETHICYLAESHEGAAVEVGTRVLDSDVKRVHLFHSMFDESSDTLLATAEIMLLHVDMAGPRSAPLPDAVAAALERLKEVQSGIPRPPQAGRAIGIRR